METDWSVAAAGDDPAIELPWHDSASGAGWVDLRVDSELQRLRIAGIPEAAGSPALAKCLALLNAPNGLLMTTKCDRWLLSEDERVELAEALDGAVTAWAVGSYIDVLMAHTTLMSDFLLHEEWARLASLRCAALPAEDARMEAVVRPANSHGVWGYGITLYCYAGSGDESSAEAAWAGALQQVTSVFVASAESLLASREDVDRDGRLS
jgi:hypothetical protein